VPADIAGEQHDQPVKVLVDAAEVWLALAVAGGRVCVFGMLHLDIF